MKNIACIEVFGFLLHNVFHYTYDTPLRFLPIRRCGTFNDVGDKFTKISAHKMKSQTGRNEKLK